MQILDSYGDTTLADNEAGAIYTKKAPDVNAATAPETWQTYDITFRAARYDASGAKTEDARVTVVWNGVTVHDDVPSTDRRRRCGRGTDGRSDRAPGPRKQIRYRNVGSSPSP
ncbi:hypothetical protein SBADM41S_10851 [Streptomyces badius]